MTDIAIDPKILLMMKHQHVMKYFPDWTFRWENDEQAYFAGWINSNSGRRYQLRLELNPQVPEIHPELFVWHPKILPSVPSGTINESPGHTTHTLSSNHDGRVQICYASSSDWDASVSLTLPLLRGVLWIEGYESHLRTGRPICEFFQE